MIIQSLLPKISSIFSHRDARVYVPGAVISFINLFTGNTEIATIVKTMKHFVGNDIILYVFTVDNEMMSVSVAASGIKVLTTSTGTDT